MAVYGSRVPSADDLEDDVEADLSRLRQLVGNSRHLTDVESLELVGLHRNTATRLATARTDRGDPERIDRLSQALARSHQAIYGRRLRDRGAVRRFFVESFPAAVWIHRQQVGLAAVSLLGPAIVIGAWLAVSPEAVEVSAPAYVREAYIETDFEAYYSSQPAAQFASQVFFNNVLVAIQAFALGVLLCLPTIWVLVRNGALLGMAGGLFTAAGRWQQFWGLITPHGLLEIAAITVAGGAGLALGWSLIAPGDRTRTAALREEGQRSVTVVLGLIGVFAVAAVIEGFVTGTALPTVIRVSIGVLALSGFGAWILTLGPAAVARGVSGRLGTAPAQHP